MAQAQMHACTQTHTRARARSHTAVPQGQGSGDASLPSLGGNSISQHAFLMWRGNYPWAVLRANRVCPPICLSRSPFLSLSLNPLLTLWLCLSCPWSLPRFPCLSHPLLCPILLFSLSFCHCLLLYFFSSLFPFLCLNEEHIFITKDRIDFNPYPACLSGEQFTAKMKRVVLQWV